MAGIGEVEDVSVALGVEHQRVLVAAVDDGEHLLLDALLLLLHEAVLPLQFFMIVRKLYSQDGERVGDVLLLEHGF